MRIALVTQDDPFYIARFFKTFLENLPESFETRLAVVCRTMGKSSRTLAKQLYEFYGPVDFLRMGTRFTVKKVLAGTVGALSRRRPVSLSQVFRAHDVPSMTCTNVNAAAVVDRLRSENLDLLVSVAAPNVFKERLLAVPRVGSINIHTAKLPQYRGMMPNFWVMYHDEPRSAITIHTMDAEIDRGQTILQREFDLLPGESLDRLIKRTKRMGARFMVDALREIEAHGIRPIEVPSAESSYFSFPKKEHVEKFRQQGKRLL